MTNEGLDANVGIPSQIIVNNKFNDVLITVKNFIKCKEVGRT